MDIGRREKGREEQEVPGRLFLPQGVRHQREREIIVAGDRDGCEGSRRCLHTMVNCDLYSNNLCAWGGELDCTRPCTRAAIFMEPPVRWQSAMLYFNDRSRVSIKIKDTKMEQITTPGCGARCMGGAGEGVGLRVCLCVHLGIVKNRAPVSLHECFWVSARCDARQTLRLSPAALINDAREHRLVSHRQTHANCTSQTRTGSWLPTHTK